MACRCPDPSPAGTPELLINPHSGRPALLESLVDGRLLVRTPGGAAGAAAIDAGLVPEAVRRFLDAQPEPPPPLPDTLSQWEIRDALKSSLERLRTCNGVGGRDLTGPAVRFDLRIEIDPSGRARATVVKKGEGFDPNVAGCVEEVIEGTPFPTAQRKTMIIYPLRIGMVRGPVDSSAPSSFHLLVFVFSSLTSC